MIVDGDTTDFAENPQDFKRIEDMIDARLFGLFPPKKVISSTLLRYD